MGFGNKHIQKARKFARSIVLPIKQMHEIMESQIDFSDISCIADFGAGTLFWSEYFASKINKNIDIMGGVETNSNKVIAIDEIYNNLTPHISSPCITLESDIFTALSTYSFDLFFASDVFHHLSSDFSQTLLESIVHIPRIVIKDIDSSHTFLHYANATHDLIFNGERVRKVYPKEIEAFLKRCGYEVKYMYIPKLWYAHFMLVGIKV